ncbi:GNAT family N-acetyltransferase [Streptomyces drozdowiczii]|uniref:GNAT family N-acetyltransferase n=1 Tax=Streptomyces drozdowiczii TaxID=202862 RepID=A0ABY6PLL0_9ACTN|nr:GNAT family N-acetyltransferase [Streptomyces drozdowiczii]MCX0247822.1 GNAT family N-acetyltransferase [Streptomyces drozdowiczii]UZK52819.1 GNAT family N-acetyltransferase [Streptomyces drozdowiczii]
MFPETVLHTERLLLRPFGSSDIPDTQASCSDSLIQQWLPLPQPYTLDDATSWCTTVAPALRESGDGIHFAVTDLPTGRLMGTVGLKKTDWRARTSEVGYWISPWARGKGFATEATRAVARWLLTEQQFQRLELRAATGNISSQKVAISAGFRREGILRNAGFVHDGRVDLVLFSLLPGDSAVRADALRSHASGATRGKRGSSPE